ncbi:MAG: hypothetical protein ACLUYZ_08445 [Lachnospiraceae bacterium]
MGELYPNQYFGIDIWKHKDLPLIESHDFNFFRCIAFRDSYYGKTISELHTGNLRVSRKDNRYSQLFPGQRLSYWADSSQTARAEAKKWGAKNNLLTFWAYDDGSSFIPTVYPAEYLRIVDGIHFGFDKILKKVNDGLPLSHEEQSFIDRITYEEPDCLAYESEALLAPGAHSQFGSGKNTQFEPEQRANPFENVFSKTAVFPPPAIAETDL